MNAPSAFECHIIHCNEYALIQRFEQSHYSLSLIFHVKGNETLKITLMQCHD